MVILIFLVLTSCRAIPVSFTNPIAAASTVQPTFTESIETPTLHPTMGPTPSIVFTIEPQLKIEQIMTNDEIRDNIEIFLNINKDNLNSFVKENNIICVNNKKFTDNPCVLASDFNQTLKEIPTISGDFYFVKMDGSLDTIIYSQVEGIILGLKTIRSIDGENQFDPAIYKIVLLGHVLPNGKRVVVPYVYGREIDENENSEIQQIGFSFNSLTGYNSSYFHESEIELPSAILEGMELKNGDQMQSELKLLLNKALYGSIIYGDFVISGGKNDAIFSEITEKYGHKSSTNMIDIYNGLEVTVLNDNLYNSILDNEELPINAMTIASIVGLSYLDDISPLVK